MVGGPRETAAMGRGTMQYTVEKLSSEDVATWGRPAVAHYPWVIRRIDGPRLGFASFSTREAAEREIANLNLNRDREG
mgnify:CR=1 FL=1